MILYAPPSSADDCRQSPAQRRQANRLALALFALTAVAGLLVKSLS